MPPTLTTPDGAAVPPFAFGTMQFGGKADECESRALYDSARAAGVAHFDTAWGYTDGLSETYLGRCVAAERGKVFVATKVAYSPGTDRAKLLEQFDTCRMRLNLDMVDLLYLHRWDPDVALAKQVETLAELQQNGQIRHIGVSNFAAWQVMKAQAIAERHGTRIDVVQPMYNLVKRQAEVEILPMCLSEGILPVPYSPLGGGLLSGKYVRGEAGRLTEDDRYAARYRDSAAQAAAEALCEIAEEAGVHPATLAVAWVARHPAGPAPILSARSVAQLEPSLAGMRHRLDDEVLTRLSALYPAPPPATDRAEER